jgi:hypothetical protein
VADPPDAATWTALGMLLVPAGAGLKYLVWDFFQKPETLYLQFSTAMTEAHASIHERQFLPTLVKIHDQVTARKELLKAASTTDILMELPIDAQVREAMAAVSARNSLDRTFQRALGACRWVAVSWLIVICTSLALFFVNHHAVTGWKPVYTWWLIVVIAGASLTGTTSFGLYLRWRDRLLRILRANKF